MPDAAQRVPIDPWYRLASTLGASATVGGLCHVAERPVRQVAAHRVDGFDLFLSIAEIAGVFVGFGALISLLRDHQEEGRVMLHAVIANGLVVLVAALIPVALSQYGLTGRALWGSSSGAFLVLCWAAIWV